MLWEFNGSDRGNLRIERCRGLRPGNVSGTHHSSSENAGNLGVAIGGAQGVGVAVKVHAAAPATGRGVRGLVTGELCRLCFPCTERKRSVFRFETKSRFEEPTVDRQAAPFDLAVYTP